MLVIKNRIIDSPIEKILDDIASRTTYFSDGYKILNSSGYIMVQCPWHKNGHEGHPSCGIYCNSDDDKPYGYFHCFTCGKSGSLVDLVSYCLDMTKNEAESWLIDNYSSSMFEEVRQLPPFEQLNKYRSDHGLNEYMDESELDRYNVIHPYMYKRKLTDEVIKKFRVGYDKETDSLTFPMWDSSGGLVAINKRSVDGKKFTLQLNKFKAVYLLNFALEEDIKTLYVVESQINALTLYSWGYPAVALCGTGSRVQLDILSKCGIKNYILCFDGDEAGRKGRDRFIKAMPDNIMCSYKDLPEGKDVNDLDKETFDSLTLN